MPTSRSRAASSRPYVICHMVPSVDGRIVTSRWPLPHGLLSEYERTAATLDGDAWVIGRVSMEPYAGRAALLRGSGARVPRTDFVARTDAPSYAIAIDPGGKLRWESGSIDEDHAVTVLTERVPDRYLAFLILPLALDPGRPWLRTLELEVTDALRPGVGVPPNTVLICVQLHPPATGEALLDVDDVQLVEWRPTGLMPDVVGAYTHVRNDAATPRTVRVDAWPLVAR